MYEQLTTAYGMIRDVDQVTNAFDLLYPGFQIGRDFEKIENARKLNEREYDFNRQLGYISLNTALNTDEVLAVAYEYTLNGQVYKVGEFSTDGITCSPDTDTEASKRNNSEPEAAHLEPDDEEHLFTWFRKT